MLIANNNAFSNNISLNSIPNTNTSNKNQAVTTSNNEQEDQEDLTNNLIPPPMNVIKPEQSEQVSVLF